jgi:N-acetylglucosamine-6-phosphate deacetylase
VIQLFGRLYDPDDRGLCLVTVERNLVTRIEPATVPVPGALGSPAARIVPGLLDIQVNGAFGDDFADAGARMDVICRQMPRFGVTGFAPTIVTSAAKAYRPAIANLARSAGTGEARVLGIHIEGPYISPKHPGTHDPAQIRLPDISETSSWLDAGPIAWFTLAPELPGAVDLVCLLVSRGVRVSMGHTDATWDDAARAADAGATMATHLFNAMRPFRHRDPGVAGYALATDLATGFIADGNHVAFETIRLVAHAKGPDRLHLVTDALAGLGMPPGRYWLAGREYVSDGTCGRLPDGTLSGSLLPMNLALGNLVEKAGLEPALAVRCATLNPARALGLEDRLGRVEVGREADLALLGGDWTVLATVVGGDLAYEAGEAREAAAAPEPSEIPSPAATPSPTVPGSRQ